MRKCVSLIYKPLWVIFFCIILNHTTVSAQNAICEGFEDRKVSFFENAIQNTTGNALFVMQAYSNLPIDTNALAQDLEGLPMSSVPDFAINQYIRLLYFSNGEYDDIVLSVLKTIPFWLPDNLSNNRQYWTENHMIQWMSADWLLHEKYDEWEVRPSLRVTLVKYLDVKIEYGYYEYFSYYNAFTLTALLNLYDFADDIEIKTKAELAIQKMLKDYMLMINNNGVYLPTAGRYEAGFLNQNFLRSIIWMITGLGEEPSGGANLESLALCTSSLDLSSICEAWSEEENITLNYGHPENKFKTIYEDLSKQDRIVFQWSAGGYFTPKLGSDFLWQLGNYNLWSHEEFSSSSFAQFLPPSIGNTIATIGASISQSSYFGDAEIDIYKNRGVVLSSTHNKWKGHAGYQIYPIMANIEYTPVFIRSGEVNSGLAGIPNRKSNEHMPYVSQSENVALVMFRPNWDLPLLGNDELDVSLRWNESDFDEIVEEGKWSIARINDSYVAVLKHCTETNNGAPACNDEDGQTWSIVVGNSDKHGTFEAFINIIAEAFYEERWYFNWNRFVWVYYGHINADGQDIDHHWFGDFLDFPADNSGSSSNRENGRTFQEEENKVSIAPNPADEGFVLDLTKYEDSYSSITIFDNSGRTVYSQLNDNDITNNKFVSTSQWTEGIYTVVIENRNGSNAVKRLVVVH